VVDAKLTAYLNAKLFTLFIRSTSEIDGEPGCDGGSTEGTQVPDSAGTDAANLSFVDCIHLMISILLTSMFIHEC
jgi:hypothetical protein